MAKKSSKSSKSKEDKIITGLRGDLSAAGELYKANFPQEALPEYVNPYTVDTANLLNLRSAYSDPRNASFAGRISDESRDVLQSFRNRATPGSQGFVNQRSGDITDIIKRFQGGLEGYTAAENTALRESALRGINDQFATDAYDRQRAAAQGRVRGGAVTAQLAALQRARELDRAGLEQDIFLKNADEKQNRLKDYSAFMRNLEDTEYGRGREAMGDYSDFQRYLDETAFTRGQGAINSYENTLGNAQNTAFDYGKFNIGQKEKTQARDVGGTLGLLGTIGTRRTEEKNRKYLK